MEDTRQGEHHNLGRELKSLNITDTVRIQQSKSHARSGERLPSQSNWLTDPMW